MQTQLQAHNMGSMKVHQLSRGLSSWDHHDSQPSLSSLSCKRLRPLAPKLSVASSFSSSSSSATFDLKSFIKPNCVPRRPESPIHHRKDQSTQVEAQHAGGTRWNPTQEQIGILEMLYRGGMRTPNAQEIEQITAQLGKYGKIEGKNVFYWFQNHKARERQKQKRNNLGLGCQTTPKTRTTAPTTTLSLDNRRETAEKEFEESRCKRTCRSWEEESSKSTTYKLVDKVTLELFPLHPEGR